MMELPCPECGEVIYFDKLSDDPVACPKCEAQFFVEIETEDGIETVNLV